MERLFIYIIDFLIIFIMFLVGCSLILKIYAVIREEKFRVTDKILISIPVTLYSVFADFFAFSLRPSMKVLSGGTYWFFKNLLFTLIILTLIYSPVILFYILVLVFRVKIQRHEGKNDECN